MASTRAAAAVDSAAAAVDSRIRMSRGAYVFVLFLGIYLTGSPLPRCILIVLMLTMEWFLVHWSKPLESAAGASWEQWHHVSKLSVISRP